MTIDNSQSFKNKAAPVGKTENAVNDTNSFVKKIKKKEAFVPLKYVSNFWRSLEMLLINCKSHLELSWIRDCILSSVANSVTFRIADAKLHVPIVTLSTEENVNLGKELNLSIGTITKLFLQK